MDAISIDEYKTKTVAQMLSALQAGNKPMLVTAEADRKLVKSAGNIPGVTTTTAGSINTYEVLRAGKLVITLAAIEKLEEVYAK